MILAFLALAAAPSAPLDLAAFFNGRTHADNVLKVVFHGPEKLVVDSVGKREGNEFVQVDTVHEGDKPVRTRVWRTREIAPGHFTGTLSDAIGPVDIVVSGNTATIRYLMSDGRLKIVQQMQLEDGGRALSNHVVAKKFGLTFAHVDGTIRKLD
jgi:hypothetical protein